MLVATTVAALAGVAIGFIAGRAEIGTKGEPEFTSAAMLRIPLEAGSFVSEEKLDAALGDAAVSPKQDKPAEMPPRETDSRPLPALPEPPTTNDPPEKTDAESDLTPPAWERNAVAFATDPGDDRPLVAIVIDDLGMNAGRTARVADLTPPLTTAFLPYGPTAAAQAEVARERGHEVIVHVPMEPDSAAVDPGPDALRTGHDEDELTLRLERALARFPDAIGINNHMGSRFTADREGMAVVMSVLNRHGFAFLDSRTTHESVAGDAATAADVPFRARDVFLDHDTDPEAVDAALALVERIARRDGAVVAIGHPYPVTIEALARWLPEAEERGLRLAPLSAVIRDVRDAEQPKTDLACGDGGDDGSVTDERNGRLPELHAPAPSIC